jgi:ATP-dependent DNA helicase 2 subunit 1|tara:strand:+ start:1574 stop:2440 length:867 start_codon:yes stop_codon:yes gene_type:complete
MMKQKIMSTPDDTIGVVFFNANKAKNEHHFVGVHQFLPLNFASSGSIDKICQLRTLVETSAKLPAFQNKVGSLDASNDNSLGDALWFTDSHIRSSNLRPQDTKRVLLFTKSDSPFQTSTGNQKTRALSRASDMGGGGVQVELWHLNPLADEDDMENTGATFELNSFYQEFLHLNLTAYRKHISERLIEVIDKREERDDSDLTDKTVFDCTMDCTDPDRAHDAALTKWVQKRGSNNNNKETGHSIASTTNCTNPLVFVLALLLSNALFSSATLLFLLFFFYARRHIKTY